MQTEQELIQYNVETDKMHKIYSFVISDEKYNEA